MAALVPSSGPKLRNSPPCSSSLPKSFPAVRASKTSGWKSWLGFCNLQQKDPWLRQVNLVAGVSRETEETLSQDFYNQPKGKLKLYLTWQILPATVRRPECSQLSAIGKVALTCRPERFKYFIQKRSPSLQQVSSQSNQPSVPATHMYCVPTICTRDSTGNTGWMGSSPLERFTVWFARGWGADVDRIESDRSQLPTGGMRGGGAACRESESPGCGFWLFCSLTQSLT